MKISHKKYDFGLTVSTREMVLQKPHVNYHIRLEDIFSVVPFDPPAARGISQLQTYYGSDFAHFGGPGSPLFKVFAQKATIHNRSGIFPMGPTEFVMPIHPDLLAAISRYGGMGAIATE
nr:hypothetical protein [Paenibacillus hamazuiensis]